MVLGLSTAITANVSPCLTVYDTDLRNTFHNTRCNLTLIELLSRPVNPFMPGDTVLASMALHMRVIKDWLEIYFTITSSLDLSFDEKCSTKYFLNDGFAIYRDSELAVSSEGRFFPWKNAVSSACRAQH